MSVYQVYPKYKDSGIEWLGQVPEGWQIKKIKRTSYLKGRVGWKGLTSSEYMDDGYAYLVTGTDFQTQFIGWAQCACVNKDRYDDDPFIQLKNGDLLITKDGTIGKLALVKDINKPACLNSGIFLIRPISSYITHFMYWVLQSNSFLSFCNIYTQGSTILHLYQNVFEEFFFPAPSVPEQSIIAAFLDHETAHIDAIISKQQQLIKLLREKRQALISHAVTKGLNPDAPMKDSGVEWLGEVPADWKIGTVGKGYAVVLGKMLQPEQRHLDERQVPYLKALHVNWEHLLCTDLPKMWATTEEIKTFSVSVGDMLVCEGGEVGRATLIDTTLTCECIIQNALHRVQAKEYGLLPYLLRILQTVSYVGWFEILCNKATIAHFTREKFVALACPYSSISEQQSIADFLDRETAKIDTLIAKTQHAIELAQERRAALISAAATGKICVTQSQSVSKPFSKSREYFQKVVLAAEITSQLHQEKTFGRVKLQKILYLSEYHARLPFQYSEYQRYAAGPHDPKVLYSIEAQMKKQKWFDAKLREDGYGKQYIPLERHNAYKQYYERYFTDRHNLIQRIIDLLRQQDTRFCEVVATIYGVWNDFLLEGKRPTDGEIFHEARTNWDPKKQAIPENLWSRALGWMREHEITPVGWGEPTVHRQTS
ncbi:MAG: restriction endonuclease subunit S [Desulfovibrio sp.]|jgi:type I restriction enzyme S subunit|nr:restriction endonuclease subunit S [Desulfovibrio sp.]